MTVRVGTIWITGLSASGKTTLGQRLTAGLVRHGFPNVVFLDGRVGHDGDFLSVGSMGHDAAVAMEEVRERVGVVGFASGDRSSSALKKARFARDYNRLGKIAVVTGITPLRTTRESVRALFPNFTEVFLDCPVEVCAARDYKGNYERARLGEIDDFVGVSTPYEFSDSADLVIDTVGNSIDKCAEMWIEHGRNFLTQTGTGTHARRQGLPA